MYNMYTLKMRSFSDQSWKLAQIHCLKLLPMFDCKFILRAKEFFQLISCDLKKYYSTGCIKKNHL